VAIFQAAFAKREGADDIVIITNSLNPKAKMTPHFGATEILTKADTTAEERAGIVMDITRGIGADVVIDTTPDPSVFREALNILRRGGTYVNSGAAVPAEPVALEMYSDVTYKNITIRGTWASDASHLEMALELVRSGGFPFERLVTHRFQLEEHERAFETYKNKEGIKIIFEP